jgi:hypothetical protein
MADEAAKLKLEIVPDSIHGDPTNIQDAEEKPPTDIFADLGKLRKESVLKVRRKILTTTVTVGKPSPNVYWFLASTPSDDRTSVACASASHPKQRCGPVPPISSPPPEPTDRTHASPVSPSSR